jgi:predicted DNA-binding helix-hairpin-helix protein
MDLEQKLKILGRSARFDLCGDCDLKGTGRVRESGDRWHYPELVPDGEQSVMLRVLMTNRCENRCSYCENAAQRDFQEATLLPEEIADHFALLYHRGQARSLFLSSAVRDSTEQTMMRMAETLELIRFRHRIPAYIHAKILPGTSDDLIQRVLRLSTRVSVNLEVPDREAMARIGHPKDFDQGLYGRIQYISALLKNPTFKKKSQTTQFVVGAAGETDKRLLDTMSHLYLDLKLSRIYFSAYQPPGRFIFGAPRAPLTREHRLYQADFLLRKYGFHAKEIPLGEGDRLSLAEDPKSAWARLHPEFFPVEINRASSKTLLRVPGLGPVSVKRILKARREGKITSLHHLEALRIRPLPALEYLLLDGQGFPNARGDKRQERLGFAGA